MMELLQSLWDQMRTELSAGAAPSLNHACHALLSGALGPLTEQQVEDLESVQRSVTKLIVRIEGQPIDWTDSSEAAHALRGPLNSTIGFSRLMLKGIGGPITQAQEQALETIHTISRRLLALFNLLLDALLLIQKDFFFEMLPLPVGTVLQDLVTTGNTLADNSNLVFEVELAKEATASAINADGKRLKQALTALLATAFKYTGDDTITCRAWLSEGNLMLQLQNQGHKLPAALLADLPNLLTDDADRTYPYDAHLRLGLAWHLLNEMSARLQAEQTNGLATFTVIFPTV